MYFVLLFLTIISCVGKNEHYSDLGNGYYLDYGGRDELELEMHFPDSIKKIISGKIINVKFNNYFVVFSRHPTYIIDSLEKRYCTIGRPIPKIIKNYTDYYIIDKRIAHDYGPFQKNEYLKIMQELNLPDSLRVDY